MNRWLGLAAVWRVAVKSLLVHPLRSLLTVLGIFIGVASVVWLLAIGEGISLRVQRQIQDLGTNNVIIRSTRPMEEEGLNTSFMAEFGLTRDDYDAILSTTPTVQHALRIRDAGRELGYGSKEIRIHLVGCTEEYASAMRLTVREGRFLTPLDVERKHSNCVLSQRLADQLFPLDSPLGKTVRIRDLSARVVGVMNHREAMAAVGSSLEAQDFSDDVYLPITTFWSRIGDWTMVRSAGARINEVVEISQLTLQINRMEDVAPTAEAVGEILRKRHKEVDYVIVTPLELLEQARTTRLMFMTFMGLIAAVSLVVGGIGIMNIMLATVTERTREIGIRRALGAKRSDIVRQFLVETVALSAVGGFTGVLGGLACPLVLVGVRNLITTMAPHWIAALPDAVRDVTPSIVPLSLPIAFGIAVGVGVAFGVYPAIRAAQMDPIEALRHE